MDNLIEDPIPRDEIDWEVDQLMVIFEAMDYQEKLERKNQHD